MRPIPAFAAALALGALLVLPRAVSAQTEAPSPRALALAARYLADARAETILENEGPVVARYMLSKVPAPKGGTAKASEVRDAMIAAAEAAVKSRVPEFMTKSATVYATIFTLKELEDIVAFYDSPSGRAFVAKTSSASGPMAEVLHDLGGEIQADTRQRFCAAEPDSCAAPGAQPSGN
jgi:hypothetical protein